MIQCVMEWMGFKWDPALDPKLLHSYQATFSNVYGQQVLKHLMDTVYCTVYEGSDPIVMAIHNGKRMVVDEILRNLDAAEYPNKYNQGLKMENDNGFNR